MNKDRQLICYITGMSRADYEALIIERAFEYIERNITDDGTGCSILTQSDYFWEWWNRQWDNRNAALTGKVNIIAIADSDYDAMLEFEQAHDATHSIAKLSRYPEKVVLDNTYCEMIGKLIKSKRL